MDGSNPACCAGFLVRFRPLTINPHGVRYASVRPLRLRLRGDRGRAPDLSGARAGIGLAMDGALKCRTIFPSHRTTPWISPRP